ncbi:MAG: hypothetical protein GWN58_27745 [Anaerolineae bacterium]|nr:hypothetical protein [Anaerolineae bacterium]
MDRTAKKVRFLDHDRQAIVVTVSGETFYLRKPKIKLVRNLRGWLRILVGWALTRRGRRYVEVVLEALDACDILGKVKQWFFAFLPHKLALGLKVGKAINLQFMWAAYA